MISAEQPTVRPPSARGGFTAIEILIVVGVMIMLIGLTVPGLVGSMRRGRVHEASNSLLRVASQARQMARTRYSDSAKPTPYFGVVIVNNEIPAYAALTLGTTATKGNIMLDANGKPVFKMTFNRNIMIYEGNNPVSSELGWLYQYRTGYPIPVASDSVAPVNVGVASTGVSGGTGGIASDGITIRTLDGQFKAAFAVYQIGVANVQDY